MSQMDKVYLRIHCESTHTDVWARDITEIDCPNSNNGIGNITVRTNHMWTGSAHVYFPKNAELNFHIGNITQVSILSDRYGCDDAIWTPIWYAPNIPFNYDIYYGLAFILRVLVTTPWAVDCLKIREENNELQSDTIG